VAAQYTFGDRSTCLRLILGKNVVFPIDVYSRRR